MRIFDRLYKIGIHRCFCRCEILVVHPQLACRQKRVIKALGITQHRGIALLLDFK